MERGCPWVHMDISLFLKQAIGAILRSFKDKDEQILQPVSVFENFFKPFTF
jgi:hypothetical protein